MHNVVAESNMAGSSKEGDFGCDHDVDMILDNSGLDIWSSSLIQESNGDISQEQHAMERPDHDMSNAVFQPFTKAPTPAATPIRGAQDYFGKRDWRQEQELAKETRNHGQAADKAVREKGYDDDVRESAGGRGLTGIDGNSNSGNGNGNSNGNGAGSSHDQVMNLKETMADDELWMDL